MTDDSDFAFLAADVSRWSPPGARLAVRRVDQVIEGRRISALAWGEGAPRRVYLHGAGLNAHAWDAIVLMRNDSAMALDLPGHGHSDWREDRDYSPRLLAESVAQTLRATTKDPVLLVGHSLGGLIALSVVTIAPELVRGIAVIDTSPGTMSRRSPAQSFFAGPDAYESREALIERAIEHGLGTDYEDLVRGITLNTRERSDGRVELRHHFAHGGTAGFRGTLDREGLWESVAAATAPILLVAGSHGNLLADDVEDFVVRLPSARAVTLDAGHNVHRDSPRELAAVLSDFEHDLPS